jgi:acyl phosphate:glycerol-3-phosphate acyltransferase
MKYAQAWDKDDNGYEARRSALSFPNTSELASPMLKEIGITVGAGALAYAMGCFVAGFYYVRWRLGVDIRESGSGAAGATNVGRLLGKPTYVGVALADIFRGWQAVAVAGWLGAHGAGQALAAIMVVVGHVWPVQLGWHGGRGAAPAYGAILALHPPTAGAMWLVLAALRFVTRLRLTKAGLGAFVASPFLAMIFAAPLFVTLSFAGLVSLLAFTHRSHFVRHGSA